MASQVSDAFGTKERVRPGRGVERQPAAARVADRNIFAVAKK